MRRSWRRPSPANCSHVGISSSPCIRFSSISSGRSGGKLVMTAFSRARFVPGVRGSYLFLNKRIAWSPLPPATLKPILEESSSRRLRGPPYCAPRRSCWAGILSKLSTPWPATWKLKGTQTAWPSHLHTTARQHGHPNAPSVCKTAARPTARPRFDDPLQRVHLLLRQRHHVLMTSRVQVRHRLCSLDSHRGTERPSRIWI